jgi:hypothetical protein
MIVINSVGKNVLETALNVLNEKYEDEFSAIKNEQDSPLW